MHSTHLIDQLKAGESTNGYEYGTGNQIVPIKFIWTSVTSDSKQGKWVKTKEEDIEWYSIEENIWPTFTYNATRTFGSVNDYPALMYNPFDINAEGIKENSHAFIWIPRILNNSDKYAYAYEDTNNKISFNDTKYYQGTVELNLWNNYFHSESGTYKYKRGTLLGRDSKSQGEGFIDSGWKEDIMEYLPEDLQAKIKSINMHIGNK